MSIRKPIVVNPITACATCAHACKSDKQYCPNYATAKDVRQYAKAVDRNRFSK